MFVFNDDWMRLIYAAFQIDIVMLNDVVVKENKIESESVILFFEQIKRIINNDLKMEIEIVPL